MFPNFLLKFNAEFQDVTEKLILNECPKDCLRREVFTNSRADKNVHIRATKLTVNTVNTVFQNPRPHAGQKKMEDYG